MATSYTGALGALIYGGKPLRNPAITDLTLVPERTDTNVPLTFGQPFKMGDWNPKTQDLELYSGGVKLQAQADDIALHVDGSVRFAVVSATVPTITSGAEQVLSLRTGPRKARVNQALSLPGDWNLRAEATVCRNQITRVKFTDRSTGGYVLGEQVQLTINGGQGQVETYTVTIKSNQVGPGFDSGTNIVNEFIALAANAALFQVYKPGGNGYETMWVRRRDRTGGAFTVTVAYTGTAVITVGNDSEYLGAPVLAVAELRAPLLAKIASLNAGTPTTGVRFHGPAATEIELVVPFSIDGVAHPHFVSRTMVRLFQGGAKIRADMALENNFLLVPNPRTITYSLQLKNGATVKHNQPVFDHFHGSRWHKAVWHSAENPEVFFKHNVAYFLDSRAVHNYDRNMGINEAAIAGVYANYQSARTSQWAQWGPLSWLLWRPGMGDTGGRDDIGPSPRWFVMHLLAQDKRTKEVMLAQSDASGTWGVHYRDENTGLLAKITDYPLISVGGYDTTPALPARLDTPPTGSDLEHQADMAYIPYLVTGDYYYLEEMQFWGGYCVLQRPAGYRSREEGLLWKMTVRAIAWSLRNVSNAARVTPETHPLKGYFTGIFDRNMKYGADTYNATKAAQGLVSPLGAVPHSETSTAPWQMDFLFSTLVLNADNGHVNAQKLVDWTASFVVERMLSPDFCPQKAGGYYWQLKTIDGSSFLTTWGQMYARNYPDLVGVACETVEVGGYAGTPNSYAAYALGMAGAAYNNGYARGANAAALYAPLANVYNAWKNDPTWAVVPRAAQT